jgi:hypothetical protein
MSPSGGKSRVALVRNRAQKRSIALTARAGRELGSYALEEYTSVKAVHWNFGEKLDWPL